MSVNRAINSTTFLLLGAIIVLGLILRVVYLTSILDAPDFKSPVLDPQLNDYWARALISGDWTPPPHADNPEVRTTPYGRPPAYPWLLAGIYVVFGDDYLFPRLVQMAVGLLNILLVFFLARRLAGTSPGLVAAFLMAVFWGSVYFEGELNSPVWEVFFTLCMLDLLLRWQTSRTAWCLALAGLLLGVGALMRPNILLAGAAATLWLVWQSGLFSGKIRSGVLSGLLFLGAATCVIAPVIARNRMVSGEFVFISYYGGINAYIGNNPQSAGTAPEVPDLYEISGVEDWNCFNYPSIVRGLERHLDRSELGFSGTSRYFYRRAAAFWRDTPLQAIRLTLRKAWLFWGPHEISDSKVVHYERLHYGALRWLPTFSHLLALALAGMVFGIVFRKSAISFNRPALTLVLMFLGGYFLSILPFFIAERYRFPAIPLLLPFAGVAIVQFVRTLRARQLARALLLLLSFAVLYLAVTIPIVPYTPSLATWHLHRGIASAARGRTDAAVASLTEALEIDPLNDEAHLQLGYIRAGQGVFDAAMDHYQQALEANPHNVFAANNLGFEYYRRGDLESAERYYRRALARQPIFTLALNNLGNVLLQEGRHEEALAHFQQVLRINAQDPFARYNIGNVYLERGAYEKAVAVYREAFEEQPFNPNIANNLGLALARGGELTASIEWFETALTLSPQYPLAHYNLGNVYGDLGDFEKACMHYESVLAIWPGHEEARKRHEQYCLR